MRIFYKLWLSGEQPGADPVALGLAAGSGKCGYFQFNDYRDLPSPDHGKVAFGILSKDQAKELIATRRKTTVGSGRAFQVGIQFNDFIRDFPSLEFVGFADKAPVATLLSMIDLENYSKRVSVVNMGVDLMETYENMIKSVATDLPRFNALRQALYLKHIMLKHERNEQVASK